MGRAPYHIRLMTTPRQYYLCLSLSRETGNARYVLVPILGDGSLANKRSMNAYDDDLFSRLDAFWHIAGTLQGCRTRPSIVVHPGENLTRRGTAPGSNSTCICCSSLVLCIVFCITLPFVSFLHVHPPLPAVVSGLNRFSFGTGAFVDVGFEPF